MEEHTGVDYSWVRMTKEVVEKMAVVVEFERLVVE